MTEPLLCSQGGVPYNKAHLDAKDAEITRICRAMTAVVEENERLRAALHDARQALNLAVLANDFGGDIKGRLRTAWLKVGDALTLKGVST